MTRELSPKEARAHFKRWAPHEAEIERECERLGARIIAPKQFLLPLADEAPWPRPLLFALGDLSTILTRCHAVVGSRKPSPFALRATLEISAAAAKAGLTVVSGLARGVDGAAHRAALDAGGVTIAVLGHGLDRIYPPEHETLARSIARHGCLVSQFPPGAPPLPGHFPARNYTIASLCAAITVIEAAAKSGSLITAHAAVEANRDVLVVTGPFGDERYDGSHSLLRQGATPVGSVADWRESVALANTAPARDARRDRVRALGGILTAGLLQGCCPTERVELLGLVGEGLAEGWLVEIGPSTYCLVDKEGS